MGLPYSLPANTPTEWQAINVDTRSFDVPTVTSWWQWCDALPEAIQFVFPNRSRSTRDASTRTLKRLEGHFVLKLKFGVQALLVQDSVQGKVGSFLAKFLRTQRENGVADSTNLFLNRTQEEMERRKGKGKGDKGKGKGNPAPAARERTNTLRMEVSFTVFHTKAT